ncbi:MAG: sulfatase-like hydrolase/transferase [Bacteroidales bacterium]|nr:sulfatase-like hydrolase/transferase [Bacteroidales bacterium]
MKKTNILLLLIFLLAISCNRSQHPEIYPNILWITCEDISPFLGCYGDTLATTPNLDLLASEGVRYDNFFANAPVCAPARFTILTGVHASSAGTMNMRSKYKIPDELETYPELLKKAGYYCTNNSKTDYNFDGKWDVWDESSKKAHYRNRAPGQPFFAVFNLTSTHESKVHKYNADELIHDPDMMNLPDYLPDTKDIRNDMAKLYDNITTMDRQAGKIIAELDESGLKDSTIVFFYSDHGGVYPRSKRYIHRSGTWVPLIVRVPDLFSEQMPPDLRTSSSRVSGSTDRLVSFVDLAPTLLSLAGLEALEQMEGRAFMGEYIKDPQGEIFLFRNRMDERIDFIRAITDGHYRYQRNFMPHRPYAQHLEYLWRAASVRSWESEYKNGRCNEIQGAYWEPKANEELYDMTLDPWEVNNLFNNPDYAGVLKTMQNHLSERMIDLYDTGFIPEGMINDINDSIEIYRFARTSAYPLKRLLDLSLTNPREGLSDNNAIVRYWAAVYCSSLTEFSDELAQELMGLLHDENPEVCLAAGEALYRHGYRKEGIMAVKKGMESDNPKVIVLAFNILEYMQTNDKVLFKSDIEEVSKRVNSNYVNRLVKK